MAANISIYLVIDCWYDECAVCMFRAHGPTPARSVDFLLARLFL